MIANCTAVLIVALLLSQLYGLHNTQASVSVCIIAANILQQEIMLQTVETLYRQTVLLWLTEFVSVVGWPKVVKFLFLFFTWSCKGLRKVMLYTKDCCSCRTPSFLVSALSPDPGGPGMLALSDGRYVSLWSVTPMPGAPVM